MASLALLGMSGFVAKFLIFLGIVISHKYSLDFKILITIIEAIGIIVTSIYLLSMLCQMFYGYKFFRFLIFSNMDGGPCEIFILLCLIFPIISIGIYPNSVSSLWNSKVNFILSKFLFLNLLKKINLIKNLL